MLINFHTLGYGALLTFLDLLAFPMVKSVSVGSNPLWMIVPIFLYSLNPIVLLQSLRTEGLVIVNFVWNMLSSISILIVGKYIFKEVISPTKMLGVLCSLTSIFLMTYNGDLL